MKIYIYKSFIFWAKDKYIFSKVFGLIIFLLSIFLIVFILYREKYFYADVKIAYSNIYYSLAFIGIIFSFVVFNLPSSFS